MSNSTWVKECWVPNEGILVIFILEVWEVWLQVTRRYTPNQNVVKIINKVKRDTPLGGAIWIIVKGAETDEVYQNSIVFEITSSHQIIFLLLVLNRFVSLRMIFKIYPLKELISYKNFEKILVWQNQIFIPLRAVFCLQLRLNS